MAPDIGRLGVDVAATQSALSEAIATVRARREQIVADTPRRTAASYGQGLGDRAARLVDLRRQAHEVRLAHIDRLQRGLGVAAGTVAAVSATEQGSRRAFRAGEGA